MAKSYASFKHDYHIASLDGLRGIAALIVVFSHTSNAGLFLLPGLDMSGTGKSGVYLFFILSSFLLTRPILNLGTDFFTLKNISQYFKRRFTRIFPLYFIFLSVAFFVTHLDISLMGTKRFYAPFSLSGNEFAQHIFLQQGKGVSWSIPVEFKYYFVLPVIAWALCKLCKINILKSAAFLMFAFIVVYMLREPNIQRLNTSSYIESFLLGAFTAVIFQDKRFNTKTLKKFTKPLLYLGLTGIVLMIPSVFNFVFSQSVTNGFFRKYVLLISLFWVFILIGILYNDNWAVRFLSSKPLRFFGHISFSLYLFHMSVINLISPTIGPLNPYFACWVIFILSIVISWISYRLIERPAAKL